MVGKWLSFSSPGIFRGLLFVSRYRTITERFLRMTLVPSRRLVKRDVSYEFMNRQMVWHAFTVSPAANLKSTVAINFHYLGIPPLPSSSRHRWFDPSPPCIAPELVHQLCVCCPICVGTSKCTQQRPGRGSTKTREVLVTAQGPMRYLHREQLFLSQHVRARERIHVFDGPTYI